MKIEDIQQVYRHDLSSFFQFAFTELHPYATYHHNWHIDVMAHYLNLISQGKIKKLIINMPPRMLKSQCVSIAWPAWELGRYQSLFSNVRIKPEKQKLTTAFKGKRQFMTLSSKLTGLGADNIIIDDPMSTEEARCDETRTQINRQFDENVLQRLSDKKNGAIVVVMQRLHENDLTGHLLAKNDGWVHINLSAIALKDEIWNLPYLKTYNRPKGEALHEARVPYEQLVETLRSIGGYAFAYQYLQGQYKPQFGGAGKGALWLTPMREGVFYDGQQNENEKHGFYEFSEAQLILSKVFGIGEDPYPSNMRHTLTIEEFEIMAQQLRISQGLDKPPE